MKKIAEFMITSCIAFTFSCLFYLLFSFLHIFPPLYEMMMIYLFMNSLGITCFIILLNLFQIQNLILLRLLEMMTVIIVLFLAGVFLNMFPLNWYYGGFVMIAGILTYIAVILITFANNRASARQINATIQAKAR